MKVIIFFSRTKEGHRLEGKKRGNAVHRHTGGSSQNGRFVIGGSVQAWGLKFAGSDRLFVWHHFMLQSFKNAEALPLGAKSGFLLVFSNRAMWLDKTQKRSGSWTTKRVRQDAPKRKWREESYKQKPFLSLPTNLVTRHISLRLLVDQSKSQKYFYLLFTYIPSTAYKKNKGGRAKGRECIYVPLIMRKYCRHNSTYDTESSGRGCRSRTPWVPVAETEAWAPWHIPRMRVHGVGG